MKGMKSVLFAALLVVTLTLIGADGTARPYPDAAKNPAPAGAGAANAKSCCAEQPDGQRGSYSGQGGCYGVPPMTSEQRAKANAVSEEYAKRMNPLRDQVFVKRQELRALQNAAAPDVNAVRECAQELAKLKRELADLHREMMTSLQKEAGGQAVARRPGGACGQ